MVVTAQDRRDKAAEQQASEVIPMTIIMVCIMLVITPFAVYWNYRMSMKDPGLVNDEFMWTCPDEYFSIFPMNEDMF